MVGGGGVIVEGAMHGTGRSEADMLFMAADLAPANLPYVTQDDETTVLSDVSFANGHTMDYHKDIHNNDDYNERLPLRQPTSAGNGPRSKGFFQYGTVADDIRQHRVLRRQQRRKNRFWRSVRRCLCFYLCNPRYWCWLFYNNLIKSYMTFLALPCFVAAWVLFYNLGNPTFDFLPDQQTHLSWWCNFVGRQILVLELSRFSQWLLLDCLVLGTRMSVQCMGPLITLTAIQAKGWPFVVFAWGAWDMVLLHGNNDFQLNWLYWTEWEIYHSQPDGVVELLSSTTYLRLLLVMVLAGLATTAKRTAVAIYFGRRQLSKYTDSET